MGFFQGTQERVRATEVLLCIYIQMNLVTSKMLIKCRSFLILYLCVPERVFNPKDFERETLWIVLSMC